MSFLVIKRGTEAVAYLAGLTPDQGAAVIRAGYPGLAADLDAGKLSFEVHDTEPLLPPPPTRDPVAAEFGQLKELLLPRLARAMFNHENRLRALEGKQALTRAQFRNALENL